MGQYYQPVLGDKNGLNCKVFDRSVDGKFTFAKLMEHSWWQNPFVNSFSKKLYNKKMRVCWVGDYADEDDDFDFYINSALHTPKYEEVWGNDVKLNSSKSVDFTLDNKFLVNFDTMQFIDLNAYKSLSIDKNGWCIHPIPLLTAVGNDRGFGDFHENNIGYECVGLWAWNLISIKTVSEFAASDWDEGLPIEYYLQIQHYLAVTDLKKAFCAVLIGGNKFSYQLVERDEETIHTIVALESDFWNNHVLKGIPPTVSDKDSELLNSLFPKSNSSIAILPKESDDLINQYLKLKSAEEEIQKQKALIENQLKSFLGNNEAGQSSNGFSVSWKTINSCKLNTIKLKTEHPEIIEQYSVPSSFRRFAISKSKSEVMFHENC